VLSVGCGWGATEEFLIRRGIQVVGVPLDPVIGACAKAKGVQLVYGDFNEARKQLANERFDSILMSYVLHLVADPISVLSSFAELLSPEGVVVVRVPNFACLPVLWRWMRRHPQYKDLGSYDRTGLHLTTHWRVAKWFQRCHLKVEKIVDVFPQRAQLAYRLPLGPAGRLLAKEFTAVGKRRSETLPAGSYSRRIRCSNSLLDNSS
jgi:2-polyprenyl-3-methyl-5-hydroxy-6-metoxy-1,4-benzoquinol methylase